MGYSADAIIYDSCTYMVISLALMTYCVDDFIKVLA
jgi:hypothetical protein